MSDAGRKRIRIGQIGIGHNHGWEKMATLRKLPELFEVVGVVEPDPVWRERRGYIAAYQGLPWLTEEQLLNTPGLQAVTVETDVPDLVATAKRCLDAGMHIHLDKPGGESLSEFQGMLDKARAGQLTVQMGYMYRHNPALQLCLRAVREGWLGRVFEVHAVMNRMDGADYRAWLSQFHGGAFYIFGCHLIDLIVAMLGKPDRVTPFLRSTRPEDDSLHDSGLAVLEYPCATATVRAAVVEVEGFHRRQFVVCGDEGTFELRPLEYLGLSEATPEHPLPTPKAKLTLARPCGGFQAGPQDVELPPMIGRYDDQLTEFARIVRGEIETPYPLDHELAVEDVVLQACGYPAEAG